MNYYKVLSIILSFVYFVDAKVDVFGITQLYSSKFGTDIWTSSHWNNGISRIIQYNEDPYDPTGWTEDHSSGTNGFNIDGIGTMTMSGDGPRFHINSLDSIKNRTQFFKNIEFTAFFQRKGTAGKNWGGMVVGVRSGPLGHASPNGDNCDATTYYARFRNDGKWDFEKELKHPESSYWSGTGFNHQDLLWGGNPLPLNRWIGMKYVIYNIHDDKHVRLELYIDSMSNGNPDNGGTWESVGSVVDSGDWPSGDVSGCNYDEKYIITQGNGTVLMRTDGDTAMYKFVSIREIVPEKTTLSIGVNSDFQKVGSNIKISCFINNRIPFVLQNKQIKLYTIQGQQMEINSFNYNMSTGLIIIKDCTR